MEEKDTGADFLLMGEKYFSREALSKALNLAVASLAGYAVRKIGPPYIKMGKRVLYPETGVCLWIDKKTN